MFACFRCGYTTSLKSNLKRHLSRKYKCKAKHRDVPIDEISKYYFTKSSIYDRKATRNAYLQPDHSHLTNKDYKTAMYGATKCVLRLISSIYFNESKPENHSIYISNLRSKYVLVYTGKQWNVENRKRVLSDLIEDMTILLEAKANELTGTTRSEQKALRGYERYREVKELKSDHMNELEEDIMLLLFNERHMCL